MTDAYTRHWRNIGRAEEMIDSAARDGMHFHKDHLTIHAQMLAAKPAKCPMWVSMYLNGYIRCAMKRFDSMIEFRYQLRDGRWVNAHDLTYEPGNDGRWVAETKNVPSGFFWKGTDHPYSGDCVPAKHAAERLGEGQAS